MTYPPRQPQPVVVTAPPTSGLATAAMIAGIFSALGGFCLLALPALAAILLGHAAVRETKYGTRGGHGQAVTGLILGYASLLPWVFFLIFVGVGAAGSAAR